MGSAARNLLLFTCGALEHDEAGSTNRIIMWQQQNVKAWKCHFLAVQCPEQLNRWPCHWLTQSVSHFYFWHYRVTLETCDLWDICSEWWEDMTWPKKLTKTNTKTMTKTKTFWEHLLRAILETCDIWDANYNSDNWEPEFMTIFVT